MTLRIARIVLLMLLALGLAACSNESRTRSPTTQVAVIHAAPSFGVLDFLRVQRREHSLSYLESGASNWDSDTYTFNVDAARPASMAERARSFTATLVAGNDYVIVLGEDGGEIRELIVEVPRDLGSASEALFVLVHTANTLGPVDVYLEEPGANLAAATPRATLDSRASSAPFNVAAADYEVSLTEVGNPANVLLASQAFGLSSGTLSVLTIVDGANVRIAPIGVLASGGGGDLLLVDRNLQAGIRAINAMTSGGALDVTIDSEFSPPLLPAVPVGIPSAYAFFDAGDRNLTVSPAGNPGVLEIDEAFTAENASLGTWFISGDPGALTATLSLDSGRVVTGESGLTIYNGVTSVTAVDVYVVAPGTDIATVPPTTTLVSGASAPDIRFELDDFEITVRQAASTNVLAGPQAVTIGAEGSYGILLTDSAGGATVDIALLDDFN